ncbi:MAG: NAD(+)/NADH kinase [Candidatus Peribacteraceae bacterium]|nr:NAD(+)/NADH kinase [Candidatus Peribacteraceae bacterium]
MSQSFNKIGLTVKSGLSYKHEAVESVCRILKKMNKEIYGDPKRMEDMDGSSDMKPYKSENDIDLLIVLGGDGTIMRAIRELKDFSTPILCINRGTIGFLAEIELSDVKTDLPLLLNNGGMLDERHMLNIKALRAKEELFSGYALNDAVIAQGTIARLVDLHTKINNEELTSFHADGLILSTPTGSTAYSLAAGGPIVHPFLSATILTPINPHSFSQKPIVVPSSSKIEVTVSTKTNKFKDTEVVLTLDGQVYVPLQHEDKIVISKCTRTVKFLRKREDTFFGTLRDKLKWGERLEI